MKDYRAYLFDWDGTLAKTTEIWLAAIKQAFANHGVAINDEDNAHNLGSLPWLFTHGLPDEETKQTLHEAQAAANSKLPEAELYDHAGIVLHELKKRNKKIALVTTTPNWVYQAAMQRHGIIDCFDAFVTGSDVANPKPDPESLFLALDKLGVRADESIMIGDSRFDIMAANNAGADSALFYTESHSKLHNLDELQEQHPTATITDLQELVENLSND